MSADRMQSTDAAMSYSPTQFNGATIPHAHAAMAYTRQTLGGDFAQRGLPSSQPAQETGHGMPAQTRWNPFAAAHRRGSSRRRRGAADGWRGRAADHAAGRALISRQLVAFSGAGVDEVVVVNGYARHAIEEQVRSYVVTLAHNDAYAAGQQGLRARRLNALSGPFDAVIIALADQPLIGAGDLTELIGAFKKRPSGQVVVPVVNGQRGNPIVLGEQALTRILSSDTNLGCRHMIERHPNGSTLMKPPTRVSSPISTRWTTCRNLRNAPGGAWGCRHWKWRSNEAAAGSHCCCRGAGVTNLYSTSFVEYRCRRDNPEGASDTRKMTGQIAVRIA